MKELKLIKIKYKNILSVGQQPCEVDLCSYNKTLVTGTNGTGKSTILEALCFALFGKPFRDIKKGLLVNSTNKKELLVELWFSYGKSKYYIKRGLKPNIFEIFKDSAKLDEDSSVKSFQDKFEQMIGMDMRSFKSTAVLGTAGYTPFMQLKTPERRRLVENLLQTDVLGIMEKLNKTRIRELNQALEIVKLNRDNLEARLKDQEQFIEAQKKSASLNIKKYNELYDQQVLEAKTTKAKIDHLNHELSLIALDDNPISKLNKTKALETTLTNSIRTDLKVVKLFDNGGCCPTCTQDLSDKSKISNVEESIAKNKKSLEKVQDVLKSLDQDMKAYKEKESKIISIETEVKNLTSTLMKYISNAKKISSMIQEASKETIDNSEEIRKLQEGISKVTVEQTNIITEKYHRGFLVEMLKDSGIKSQIISEYLPVFNKQINHYLTLLGADYSFMLDSEFNEIIKSRGREEFSYFSFSEGEKARIDISLLFTWRDIAAMISGVKIKTLFLDEVFDGSMDSDAAQNLGNILSSMTDYNIFVISHRDHNPDDYDNHIQLKKIGRFSVMS